MWYGGNHPGPVTVYLHGKGGFGHLSGLYEYEDFPRLLRDGNYHPVCPFLILHARSGENWQMRVLNNVLSSVAKQCPERSIHLMGYSRGGIAVYEHLSAYPSSPVKKATVINSRLPSNYSGNVPLDIFHAALDHTQPLADLERFTEQQNSQGQQMSLMVTPGDHFNIGPVARQILASMSG